jgi:uncharacterized RDD family membrane protein YckC
MSDSWYIGRDGQRLGPFSSADVKAMVAAGDLRTVDLAWREGMAQWVAIETIPALSAERAMPVSAPPRITAAEPVRRAVAPPPPGAKRPLPGVAAQEARNDGQETVLGHSGGIEYAGYMSRVWAALLDGVFMIPAGVVAMLAIVLPHAIEAAKAGPNANFMLPLPQRILLPVASMAIGVVYYAILDASARQGTWGKQFVGLVVTDLQGRRLTRGRAACRAVARYLPGLLGIAGEFYRSDALFPPAMITAASILLGVPIMLMPLFTPKRQALHDLLAGCLVLRRPHQLDQPRGVA